ncbi:DUF6896 domain-containing protein [Aquimarina sp. M1]
MNSTEKLLLKSIIEFDKKANELISLMAKEYQLDLNQENPFRRLTLRSNNLWKGSLINTWDYKFHGDACEFENTQTKQFLDIKITRKNNFGTISNFYLLKFIETTESLKHVFEKINSMETLHKNLTELENKGFIIDIGESSFNTRVLNKEKAELSKFM